MLITVRGHRPGERVGRYTLNRVYELGVNSSWTFCTKIRGVHRHSDRDFLKGAADMKILMATMGLDIGGAETHIVELAKELKAEGHDIVVASNGGVYVPEIVAAGIRHYQVPMHRRDAGCMLRSRKLLKEIIRMRGRTWCTPTPASPPSCAAPSRER